MSHPHEIFGTQNLEDDDGPVIDSLVKEVNAPPDLREAIAELTSGLREALIKPQITGRLLSGNMVFGTGANRFTAPTLILPADPRRKSLTLSASSNTSNAGALTQLISTGLAVSGPTTLRSVTITSSDGATSGNGKVEVRDSTTGTGAVLLTLTCGPGDSETWQSDGTGIPITNGVHLTISGTGPGNFAMVETESAENAQYLSIADENGKVLTSAAMNLRPGANTPLTLGAYTGALFAQLPPTASASMELNWIAVTE